MSVDFEDHLCHIVCHLNFIYLGGNIAVQQKHQAVKASHCNGGFFITTNIYPDFGPGRDGEAIRKRLSVFHTSALPQKDTGVSGK